MVIPMLCTLITIHYSYMLITTKLDAMGHRWIAKLMRFNFTIYYWSGEFNIEADALSRIPCYQTIKAEAVEAIFKAAVEDPKALKEVSACHEKAVCSLILESPLV